MKKRGSKPQRLKPRKISGLMPTFHRKPKKPFLLKEPVVSKDLIAKPAAIPVASVLKREVDILQREIDKQTRFLLHPLELHAITLVVSIVLLAIIFQSQGIVLYFGILAALLLIGSVLHWHGHQMYHVSRMLGLFIIPALITLLFMPDTLLWVLLGVFVISFISSFVIQHWHNRVHKLSQVMLVSVYSRIVSLTASVLLLVILPSFVLPDAFVSIAYILSTIILPATFVYFFLSRSMYLYFFDPRHPRLDVKRSLHQAVLFSGAFFVIVIILYASFASVFFTSHASRLSNAVDERVRDTIALQKTLEHRNPTAQLLTVQMALQEDIQNTEVFKELDNAITHLMNNFADLRSRIDTKGFAFVMALDDSYFTTTVEHATSLVSLSQQQKQLFEAKRQLFEVKEQFISVYQLHEATIRVGTQFEDGSKTLEEHIFSLQQNTLAFEPARISSETLDWILRLDDPAVPASYVEKEGIGWLLTREPPLNSIYRNRNVFEERAFFVARHTRLFLDLLRLKSRDVLTQENEQLTSPFIAALWNRRTIDETDLSKAIRLELIQNEASRLKSAFV